MSQPSYLNVRPTAEDLQHLETIARNLRETLGRTFVSRSDAVRHALGTTAGAMQNTATTINTTGATTHV